MSSMAINMLTFFHFEKCTFESDVLGRNIICDSLTDHWQNYGCLILSKEALKNIQLYISCYPQKSREKWRIGFSYYKTIEISNPDIAIEPITNTEDLILKLNEINAKSLIHNQSEETLPTIDNDKLNKCNLESIHIEDIHSSINFTRSKKNASTFITASDNLQKIWDDRFNSLALVSKKITIIDRYLYSNIMSDNSRRKETALLRFLKLLPDASHKYSISIYSDGSIKSSKMYSDITNYVDSVIKNNPILKKKVLSIDFNSCLDTYFMNNAHDRLITFDDYACEIGIGMEIFCAPPLRPTSFSIKPKSQTIFTPAYAKLSAHRSWHAEVSF